MRFSSLCLAHAFVSSTVFAQAKPSDLAPTPVTQSAGAQQAQTGAPAKAAKAKIRKAHRKHAKVGKKRLNTASARAKKASSSAVR